MTTAINTGVAAPSTGTAPEGHDAAMLAAVDKVETSLAGVGTDAPAATGEKILGKFDSQADLEKAYMELQRKLGQGDEPTTPKTPVTPESTADAETMLEKAGVDTEAMAEYFYAYGELTEEQYAELEAAGVSRPFVDQYIRGVEAEAAQLRDGLMSEIGGEDEFSAMSAWAASNLSKEELASYNRAVESHDMDVVRSAVMSLAFKYQRTAGRDPQLLGGQANGNSGGGFESLGQLTEAMKDPRYSTDAAYRKDVEQRLSRSNIF